MADKLKLIWLSDSPFLSTGFSSQSLFTMNRLADKGWDIVYVGNGFTGQELAKNKFMLKDGTPFNFELWPTSIHKRYGRDIMPHYIKKFKPDVWGGLLDSFMLQQDGYQDMDFAPAKSCFWFPSDGHGRLPLTCENIIRMFDAPVAMSKFAQKQAWEKHKLKTEYIPHAINTELFSPMTPEEKEKLKLTSGLQGKFVVGCVSRNQGRKALDLQLKAFEKFCRDKPDAIMLMHTDPHDPAQTFNMPEYIARLQLQNRIKFTGTTYYNPFPYAKMREVYNLFDVFLLTTTGEGFGIPTVEAMSCKIPTIITDCTTTPEFLIEDGKCGEPVKVATSIVGGWNVDRQFADIDDTVEKLNKLYYDSKLRKLYGEVGRRKVLERYTWPIVTDAWDKLLKKMVEE